MMGLILTNDGQWRRTIRIDSRQDNWYYNHMVWCQEHCAGEWEITPVAIAFEKDEDAVFFELAYKQ